jgi:uncharacterized membrane-anchored protein YitT (DUF2179 family)
LIIACAIGAFSLTAVLIPNGLTSGGLTGIIRMIQNFLPFATSFSLLFYIGTAFILIFVAVTIGLKEVRKIIFLSILFPAILVVFEWLDLSLLEEQDTLLAAVFVGVFSGICSGIVFWRGYAFGGSDAVAKVIKKKWLPHIGISKILLVVDAVIIISSAFVFGRNIALYALITQVIFARTIDFVLYGFESKIVQLEIITDLPEEVTEYIMNDIGRGVTENVITGAYTKQERRKIVTLCSPRESALIKRFIAKIDKSAFVVVIQVNSVWGRGEGFGDIDEVQ